MQDYQQRTKRILDLQELLVQFAEIERHIYFPDGKKKDRKENDSEHSFNLAMTAWYLSHSFPYLDKDKLIRYALAHDFVEVHAGDVMAVGRTAKQEKAKKLREEKALKKIQKEWADFPDLIANIESYETRQDSESKFIYALDKLMPMMLNIISGGKTWKSYKMSRQDVFASKDSTVHVSDEVNEIWLVIKTSILDNPEYFAHNTKP